jgi:undecaprenyl-diphosphatase
MDWLYALTKAVVQALTEFLPVSSSAHLILTNQIFAALGRPVPNQLVEECYDVFLHVGTLIAVIVYFRKELHQTLQAMMSGEDVELMAGMSAKKLPLYIMASTVVTVAIVGSVLLFTPPLISALGLQTAEVSHLVDYYRANPGWVGWHLMATGLVLLAMERFQAQQFLNNGLDMSHKPLTLKSAMVLGAVQSCSAIFRGLSRSGASLAGGLACGLARETAARYAFLMGMPAFVLAAGYAGLKLAKAGGWAMIDWPVMVSGLVLTAILGYGVIAFFLKFVSRNRLDGFGWYCLAMGCVIAYWLG